MARQKFEFYCTECHRYFDFMMNMSLNGWFRIHCPSCKHIHYRKVTNGLITGDRFTDSPGKDDPFIIEDIMPMPSSCRDFQKEKPKEPGPQEFLGRLWSEIFSERVSE